MYKYDSLREHALANFELLLDAWGIEWTRINHNEYDLIAKWRADGNFGAVRFNTYKGRGSDFAGYSIAKMDFGLLGEGFDKSDFAGIVPDTNTNVGFDIIGLYGKVHGISSYRDAARGLSDNLHRLSQEKPLIVPASDAAKQRQERIIALNKSRIEHAKRLWAACKNNKLENSFGDAYLTRRGLPLVHQREKCVRYHPKVKNVELDKFLPCLLFKVSFTPTSDLVAIHRIYVSEDGRKADVTEAKMALANIKGAGIWFGTPGYKLSVAEGPENALSIRELGAQFVVSTINATNFANLTIPEYVDVVELYPDPDPAGRKFAQAAVEKYTEQGKKVIIKFPPEININNKLMDWNDVLQEAK